MSSPQRDDNEDQHAEQDPEPEPGGFVLDTDVGAQALDSALRLIPPPLARLIPPSSAAASRVAAEPFPVDNLHDFDLTWDGTLAMDDVFGPEATEYLHLEPGPSESVALPASTPVPAPSEIVSGPRTQGDPDTVGRTPVREADLEGSLPKTEPVVSVEKDATSASFASMGDTGGKQELSELDGLTPTNSTSAVKRSASEGPSSTPPPHGRSNSGNPARRQRASPPNAKRSRSRPLQVGAGKSSLIPIAPRASEGSSGRTQRLAMVGSSKQTSRPAQAANGSNHPVAQGGASKADGRLGVQCATADRSPSSNVSRDVGSAPVGTESAQQQSQKASVSVNRHLPFGMAPPGMFPLVPARMYPIQHHQNLFPPTSSSLQGASPMGRRDSVDVSTSLPANAAPGVGENKKMRVGEPQPVSTSTADAGGMAAVAQHQVFPSGVPMASPGVMPYDPGMMRFIMAQQQMYFATAAAAGYNPAVMGGIPMGSLSLPGNVFPQYGAGNRSAGPGPSDNSQANPGASIDNSAGNVAGSAGLASQAHGSGRPAAVSDEGPQAATPQQSFAQMAQPQRFARLHLQSMSRAVRGAGGSDGGRSGPMRLTDTQGVPPEGSPRRAVLASGGIASDVKANPSSQAASSSGGEQPRSQKKRLVWTPELHERFVKAIDLVGLERAVPKMLVNIMNVDGLTTEHVKSHLQKYRNSIRKEQAEEARERSQGVSGAHVGRGIRVAGAGAPAGLNRSNLGVSVAAGGVRKYPILPNRISLFGTPVSGPGAASAGPSKGLEAVAGSARANISRSGTPVNTHPVVISANQPVVQHEKKDNAGPGAQKQTPRQGTRNTDGPSPVRAVPGIAGGRTAGVRRSVVSNEQVSGSGGSGNTPNEDMANPRRRGTGVRSGTIESDTAPIPASVLQTHPLTSSDRDSQFMTDIDFGGAVRDTQNAHAETQSKDNGPSVQGLDSALGLEENPGGRGVAQQGDAVVQNSSLTEEEREVQLQLIDERTLHMQLQLQMMVHRTIALEKKYQQESSEQMREEASGAATSGRSARDGEGGDEKKDSLLNRKDSGDNRSKLSDDVGIGPKDEMNAEDGRRDVSGGKPRGEHARMSEVTALLQDQERLSRQIEEQQAIIRRMKDRKQSQSGAGRSRSDGGERNAEAQGGGNENVERLTEGPCSILGRKENG